MSLLKIEHHHYLHSGDGDAVFRILGKILTNTEQLMAQSKEMTDFIARLNTATNTLAQRVDALKDKITQGGMSEADEKAGIAEADAITATLEKIGADPVEPLPEPELPPVP